MNYNVLRTVLAAAAEGEQPGGLMSIVTLVFPMILLFGVMYFLMIRPQKKREKKVEEMRSQLAVGDEVVTSGGIIGRVVSIQEDNITIETGSARSKIRVARWAVQSNNTIKDNVPEE